MSSGFCGIPGMSQPRLEGLFNLDCELYCYGVEKTDGAGIVLECDDFEPSPGGDAQ